MNRKQMIGWLSVLVGIVLIVIAINSRHKFSRNKEKISTVKVFFTHNPLWNPIIKFFGGKPQEKIPAHNEQAMITQTVGIVLVVVGGAVVYLSRNKTRRPNDKTPIRKRKR
jgi:uncharacterized membrane protein YidH (DUF202 family)